ncbi:MAG: site-specific integrase [Planctomycetes bacterium]|nr:site-specific integrase [Planctomycetota bacterium]
MPLTIFKRGKIFYIRGTVAKKTVYESTGTTERARAEACRAKREKEIWDATIFGERATVTFLDAVTSFNDINPPTAGTRRHIRRLLDYFCPTWRLPTPDTDRFKLVREIDQACVDEACREILQPVAKPATRIRNVQAPLTAILNHAAKRGWCDRPVFERPKLPKGKTRWLTPSEAQLLLRNSADHLRPVLLFLLGTGARMSEALYLDWADVDLAESRAVFRDTKNGKDRLAKLPSSVVAALSALSHREGEVFLKPDGKPYANNGKNFGGQIKTGFKATCRRAGLGHWEDHPERQDKNGNPIPVFKPNLRPHDLRHTWATWFYAVSKDPMLLKSEGGWSSIALVERYAHLMTSDLVQDISGVWGACHPAIGGLQIRAKSVHSEISNS